ncbi:hypothetical protein G3N95_24270 [Paraburkholderia sp. Tr-20389]|uniref:hypothetical protein n=1 Tax=Paraburkholderia sp. Tr-20389 TaxID=2703903 RepID=UPI00197FB0DD|nr:hypothetical protein [Paraburkholderia sp. Tr-20389]MBN3756078.1 hypothetical protein [Paraburkholderia sp. Tr-20389]
MRALSGTLAIAALAACSTVPSDQMRAGHNTTFPPLPACLFFCFARVDSTIDTTNSINRQTKAGSSKPASAAPPLPGPKEHP